MHLVAKVFGEDLALAEMLAKAGISTKLVHGGLIVELPKHNDTDDYRVVYTSPPELKDYKMGIAINCREYGGGMSNSGDATVMCYPDGLPIHPYHIPRSGHLSNGIHALFSVPVSAFDTIMVVEVRACEDWIQIIGCSCHLHPDLTLEIVEKTIWKGYYDETLPESIKCFTDAIAAAVAKANCYHCREPHFIAR